MKNLEKAVNLEKVNKVTVDFYQHVDVVNRCGEGRLIRVHKDHIDVLEDPQGFYFISIIAVSGAEKEYKKYYKVLA